MTHFLWHVNRHVFYTFYNSSERVAMFEVCFEKQNVRIGRRRWLFTNRHAGRFEFIALLAYRQTEGRAGGGWVSIDEISRLPSWRGKTRHHIGTNIGRYLQAFERSGFELVIAENRWVGPYRLALPAGSVSFDLLLTGVRKRLGIARERPNIGQEELHRFVLSYVRAQWLYFQGRLVPTGSRQPLRDNAYQRFSGMSTDSKFCDRLRLLACLEAVRVLFRLGKFQGAQKTLEENRRLMQRVDDPVLKTRYHLALAWIHQRGSSGTATNRATERALSEASQYAEAGGDRASMGLVAYRRSGFLTKKRRYQEAIAQLLCAIEAAVLSGNFDHVQAYCGDMGSVLHRIGPASYSDARRWLLLGIAIARWMRIGGEDAHGEMILGKIYAERGKQPRLAQFWLRRAERIAESSGNRVNLGDVKMVWAFWYQQFGSREEQIKTLAEALLIFRGLRRFDCQQKERYMARKFPSLWPRVLKTVEPESQSELGSNVTSKGNESAARKPR
jgi:tetratricopeptide (TPR) repeat protein